MAEAMGIIQPASAERLDERGDVSTIRTLAVQMRRAGIASAAAAAMNDDGPRTDGELASLLRTMIAALEASPAPKFEWTGLARVLDAEQLASLLGVSASSLNRYQSGERDTPDAIAARLHFLALIIGDLAGSYNHLGIRRWFQRRRTPLDGRAPADVLKGEWDPDDSGPARVRELARGLVTLSAT
jgi:transcriptional regulator with XRE-family HTH domain